MQYSIASAENSHTHIKGDMETNLSCKIWRNYRLSSFFKDKEGRTQKYCCYLSDRVININSWQLQGSISMHFVKIMDASGRLLRYSFDSCKGKMQQTLLNCLLQKEILNFIQAGWQAIVMDRCNWSFFLHIKRDITYSLNIYLFFFWKVFKLFKHLKTSE